MGGREDDEQNGYILGLGKIKGLPFQAGPLLLARLWLTPVRAFGFRLDQRSFFRRPLIVDRHEALHSFAAKYFARVDVAL
jgi:hypothetical protein